MNDAGPKNVPLYFLNLILCVSGTLIILWFAIGVEKKSSRAQAIFEWMLAHSTPIIIGSVLLMVFILIVSCLGSRSLKGKGGA